MGKVRNFEKRNYAIKNKRMQKLIKIPDVLEKTEMIEGTCNAIRRRLLIKNSEEYTNEIMQKIDVIVAISTDLGIDIARAGFDEDVKTNLYKARK